MQQVVISARPLLPSRNGVPQAYGLYVSAALNTATGERIDERGISEAAARRTAQRAACAAWGELLAFLDAEDRHAEAVEAGDTDPRD